MTDFEKTCFFIAPIGEVDSDIRRRSDGVRDYIVKPAAANLNLEVLRADQIAEPGQITLQVIEHVLSCAAVVADLTGSNANVFYELAIRHTARLPVVLIAEAGERLPFDITTMRTIFFDHRDLASASQCISQITAQMTSALGGAVDSPVATAVSLASLERGNTLEQAAGNLLSSVDGLSRQVAMMEENVVRSLRRIDQGPTSSTSVRRALEDADQRLLGLRDFVERSGDPELQARFADIQAPIRWIVDHLDLGPSSPGIRRRRTASPVVGDFVEVFESVGEAPRTGLYQGQGPDGGILVRLRGENTLTEVPREQVHFILT